ncbi:GAF domain-containing protein [Mycolicibacterium chubuense NBB4]|uniref:GAF domain-containing protein n=2 Tax=Mycolicibacterium chubuense TaxID=1800 RepID=I4BKQ3_MYCCN|nr:GAF domain-containing protein [Mycolicibacterium chubuense NBB4]
MARLSDAELRELKQGLVAAVVGAGVDDAALSVLIRQLTTDPDALKPVVQLSLNDPSRLAALNSTGLMAGGAGRTLDTVALLAAEALATPFVAISLLDDSTELLAGLNVDDGDCERVRSADLSIGKFTVATGIPFIVDDAKDHPLLAGHPTVLSGAVGAYAGIPIFSDDDDAVGSMCAWDTHAVNWTGGQILVLQDMADLASAKIFRRPI